MGRCRDWTRSVPFGMKAQSELTGDRKRQAETTCPRKTGATNSWMSMNHTPQISESARTIGQMFGDLETEDFKPAVSGIRQALSGTPAAIFGHKSNVLTEVIHRPAAR